VKHGWKPTLTVVDVSNSGTIYDETGENAGLENDGLHYIA